MKEIEKLGFERVAFADRYMAVYRKGYDQIYHNLEENKFTFSNGFAITIPILSALAELAYECMDKMEVEG